MKTKKMYLTPRLESTDMMATQIAAGSPEEPLNPVIGGDPAKKKGDSFSWTEDEPQGETRTRYTDIEW